MGFLASLASFGGSWNETSREKLDPKELKEVKSVDIVERANKETGEPFLSMCFHMKNGTVKSHYLSKKSDLSEGDSVDPKSVEVITLERDGVEILRLDGEAI